MDFLKDAVQKAGQNAAQDAAIDGAAAKIAESLGGNSSSFVTTAAAAVKSGLKEQPTSESVKTETTVTSDKDGNTQVEKNTTYKADYIDKGIDIFEKNVLKTDLPEAQDQQIAGFIRKGIESYQKKDSN